MREFVLLICILLSASCHGETDIGKESHLPRRSSEEKDMIRNLKQPFANPQLNSLLPLEVRAKGNLAWKLEFNPQKVVGSTKSLIVLDDIRAILDYGDVFFAIDLSKAEVLSLRPKSTNTYIVVANGQKVFYSQSHLLLRQDFDLLNTEPEIDYDLPGLGPYSALQVLIPGPVTFVAGIQGMGNPRYPEPAFSLLKKEYTALDDIWNLEFPGIVARPPMSAEGHFAIAQPGEIAIVDLEGKSRGKVTGEFLPICCSIGRDNRLYIVYEINADYIVRAMDLEGQVLWEHEISITQPSQPPVVNSDQIVYIVGSSKIEAFSKGNALWTFKLHGGSESPPLASATINGKLLVSDGNRVVSLSESGDALWIYQDDEADIFRTQPVLDSSGKVYVATDKKIIALK